MPFLHRVALLLACLATSGTPAGAQAPDGGYYRLKVVKVIDQEGFGQPVEAFRLLVPAEWKANGWVRWVPSYNCPANIIDVGFQSASPDGLTSFEVFTPYTWQWTDDPAMVQMLRQSGSQSCPVGQPTDATNFLKAALIPNRRSGARVLRVEPLPKVAKAEDAKMRAALASSLQAGLITGLNVDGARVRLAEEINGRPVEEWVGATITVIAFPGFSTSAAMQGSMAQANTYAITASNLLATRAPKGQLEAREKLFAMIIGSIRPNQAWINAVIQTQMAMGNAAIKGAADRSRIWAQASNDIGNTYSQGYQQQQAVQDRLAEQYSQSVRGVETYVDPTTREPVELTGGYKEAWSNGRGEYILSDDATFDPAATLHEHWTQMERPGQ
jgi:hypothetical protein